MRDTKNPACSTSPLQHTTPGVPRGSAYPPEYPVSPPSATYGNPIDHARQGQQPQPIAPEQRYYNCEKITIHNSPYTQAVPIANLGMTSAPVDCPFCGQRQMTIISHRSGNTTHGLAAALCCITGICCFVPYLMKSLKNVRHKCGSCEKLLATWHKSGNIEVHAYP